MACFNCTKGYYCQFHRGSTKLVTSIAYSKTYHVFDLINGTNKSIIQRDKEREKNYYIEIEEKTATCTKCHSMSNCQNYFVITKSGTANVCICNFCLKTQFANKNELMAYVKNKLLLRYKGFDKKLIQLLKFSPQ
tara:strand:+ start:1603 stop:2007 length:405 start_codon:yes stop_codon:yes gene_type:complete